MRFLRLSVSPACFEPQGGRICVCVAVDVVEWKGVISCAPGLSANRGWRRDGGVAKEERRRALRKGDR